MGTFFKIYPKTKKVLFIGFIISVFIFAGAYLYYSNINQAEDPRVIETKFLFKDYEKALKENKLNQALSIMDSIEYILLKTTGYNESFELGIVYNNKGSIYLTKALYTETNDSVRTLDSAYTFIQKAINTYEVWDTIYGSLNKEEIQIKIDPFFSKNDPAFYHKKQEKILKKRIDDLLLAQKEFDRRLSVCYTNLGICLRHQLQQEAAIDCHIKAIKLWKDNYTARNNFNVLMGREPEDRSILDQLFPPKKNNFN